MPSAETRLLPSRVRRGYSDAEPLAGGSNLSPRHRPPAAVLLVGYWERRHRSIEDVALDAALAPTVCGSSNVARPETTDDPASCSGRATHGPSLCPPPQPVSVGKPRPATVARISRGAHQPHTPGI